MNQKTKFIMIAICGGISFFFILFFKSTVEQLFFLFGLCDKNVMVGYMSSFGAFRSLISIFLTVFQSVVIPFPDYLMTLANSQFFGPVAGAALSWIGQMAGAALCFALTRFLGRPLVKIVFRSFAGKLRVNFYSPFLPGAVFIARLIPFIPFDLVSYFAGFTPMGFRGFMLATGLGQLPLVIYYSFSGQVFEGPDKVVIFVTLVLTSLSFYVLKRFSAAKQISKL
ncbi:MAG: TVP38/TMEM64 family protein [Desulfobacteraceae bacterium]|nr:TVP38/TMEM64 family protein [Desulfobacteraceae bacterium]